MKVVIHDDRIDFLSGPHEDPTCYVDLDEPTRKVHLSDRPRSVTPDGAHRLAEVLTFAARLVEILEHRSAITDALFEVGISVGQIRERRSCPGCGKPRPQGWCVNLSCAAAYDNPYEDEDRAAFERAHSRDAIS